MINLSDAICEVRQAHPMYRRVIWPTAAIPNCYRLTVWKDGICCQRRYLSYYELMQCWFRLALAMLKPRSEPVGFVRGGLLVLVEKA